MRRFRVMSTVGDVQYTSYAQGLYTGFHKPWREDPEMWKRVVFIMEVRSRLYLRSFNPCKIGVWRVKKLHVDCQQSSKRELL